MGGIKTLGPATAAAGLARSVGSEPAMAVRGAGSAAAGRPTAAGTAATAGRAGTIGRAGTSEWTSSSRATGASAFSGSQSPASNSITAGGPSAHGAAPISSYMPGGNGVGLTGTSVAGVSVSGVSVTGTRAAGTSIAGLGLAAIPAEHWARRLASSRAGTAGGFTTEPLSAVRRRPAFVSVGTPKVAAALPTVAAAVAAAGSSLPRSVNPGPPRPNYGAGIRRSPGEQTVAVQKSRPGPTSPPFGLRHQDASIAAEALNIRRHATPGPPVNPQAAPGLPSPFGLHTPVGALPTAAVIQGLNRPRTTAARRNDVNQRVGERQFRGRSQRLVTEPVPNGRPAHGLNSPTANSLVPLDNLPRRQMAGPPPGSQSLAPNLQRAVSRPAQLPKSLPPNGKTSAANLAPYEPAYGTAGTIGTTGTIGTAGLPVLPIAGAAFALGHRQASAQGLASSKTAALSKNNTADKAERSGAPANAGSSRTSAVGRTGASTSPMAPASNPYSTSRSASTASAAAMTGFALTAEGARNPMSAPSSRSEVRRATSTVPSALSLPAGPRSGPGTDGFPSPGGAGSPSTAAGQVLPEQSRGPQLSEQLDMLSDVLAGRRLAELERRGLFLHPEVF